MVKKTNTLYNKAKHKYLADIISIETPNKAVDSVGKLFKEFHNAKSDAKKLRIVRATDLAMKRAEVGSTNPRVSATEQKEFKAITKIYKHAYEIMKFMRDRNKYNEMR